MNRMTDQDDEMWETLPLKQRGFISPTLLMNPWALAGLAAVFAIYSFYIYNKGYNSGYQYFLEYRAKVEAANEQVRLDTERKLAELADLQQRTERGWRAALDALRSGGVIRVRPHSCPGAVPAVPAAPSGANEAATERVISAGECEAVANNAVQDAAQVLWLTDFIRKQHEATK